MKKVMDVFAEEELKFFGIDKSEKINLLPPLHQSALLMPIVLNKIIFLLKIIKKKKKEEK